jgi:hypothetical protein
MLHGNPDNGNGAIMIKYCQVRTSVSEGHSELAI